MTLPMMKMLGAPFLLVIVFSSHALGFGDKKPQRALSTDQSDSTSYDSSSVNEQYHNYALTNPYGQDPKYFRDDFSTVQDGQPPAWLANRYKVYCAESGMHYAGDYFGYENLPLHPVIHAPGNFEIHLENKQMRYHLGEYPEMDQYKRNISNEKAKHRSLQHISKRHGKTGGIVSVPDIGLVLYHNKIPELLVEERVRKGHFASLLTDAQGYMFMMHPYIEDNESENQASNEASNQ